MEFREFLSRWLAGSGWSLTQFADEVGVSQSLVSKWLHANPRRRVRPSPETIHRLSEVLRVGEVDLLGMLGYFSDGNAPVPNEPLDPDFAVVKASWPSLEEWARRAIRTLAASGRSNLTNGSFAVPARA